MAFLAEAFGAWIVQELGIAARKRAASWFHGTEFERALRAAGEEAVARTAAELLAGASPADVDGFASALNQVFLQAAPDTLAAGSKTLVESLDESIRRQLAPLADDDLTGVGQSYTDLVGIPLDEIADTLFGELLRVIRDRGASGGPLSDLAGRMNHDITHLQHQQTLGLLERIIVRLDASPPVAPRRSSNPDRARRSGRLRSDSGALGRARVDPAVAQRLTGECLRSCAH